VWKKLGKELGRASAVILLGTVGISQGCVKTVYVPVPELPVPDRPQLVEIHPDSLECLSDETYEKLVVNDVTLIEHIKRLEDVIRQTHEPK